MIMFMIHLLQSAPPSQAHSKMGVRKLEAALTPRRNAVAADIACEPGVCRASESSSAALVGPTLGATAWWLKSCGAFDGGEAAFTDRRHCSLISREEQIAAREGRTQ